MSKLSLKNVYKVYDGNVTAVEDFNLEKMCIRDRVQRDTRESRKW